MDIKLSVIIPCYNHGKYLPEALASVDNSVYRNQIEIIIVNDGSTDPFTNELIDELDPNKYVIIKQENQGLARSRNNGIMKAKADYVLMLDADNYIEPVFIEDFYKLLHKGVEFDALYGNASHFGAENFIRTQGQYNLYKLTTRNSIDACAIFKKQKLFLVGLYDENMPYMGLEDWDLWIRLGLFNSKIIYVDKMFFNYRVSENSMIRKIPADTYNLTMVYFKNKYILYEFYKDVLEDYLNNQISLNTILKLLLKKFKVNKKNTFKQV